MGLNSELMEDSEILTSICHVALSWDQPFFFKYFRISNLTNKHLSIRLTLKCSHPQRPRPRQSRTTNEASPRTSPGLFAILDHRSPTILVYSLRKQPEFRATSRRTSIGKRRGESLMKKIKSQRRHSRNS